MSAELSPKVRKVAEFQAGMITRNQAVAAGMSLGEIDAKLRYKRWRQVYWGVYATFTGPLPRLAQLWAAVLYAGEGALLSHESAGELQGLVDEAAAEIHVTVPARRRVRPVKGLVIHGSDVPEWPDPDDKELPKDPERRLEDDLPQTTVADTIIDLAEACDNVDDVYGWVTRAFGRYKVTINLMDLLVAISLRKRLRWRIPLTEAALAADGGAHSALELLWEVNVEQPHGIVPSLKQVQFTKPDGSTGFRDREYVPYGLVVELDGTKSHREERRGQDNARDRSATVGSKSERSRETMRYGWRETRYEGCQSAVAVIQVLWRRGWRGRPWPCSPDCPVAALLRDLYAWLAEDPERQRRWLEAQAAQEAVQQARASRRAATRAEIQKLVDEEARRRRDERDERARRAVSQPPGRPRQRNRKDARPRQPGRARPR